MSKLTGEAIIYIYVITFVAVLVIYIMLAITGCSVFVMMLVDNLNLIAKLESEKNLLLVRTEYSLENQIQTHTQSKTYNNCKDLQYRSASIKISLYKSKM